MKKLIIKNEILYAEKIIKHNKSIVGLNENKLVFSFTGILDFSIFKIMDLNDNEIEFDLPQLTIEEQLNNINKANLFMALTLVDKEIGGNVNG